MNEYFSFQVNDDDDMSAFVVGYRTKYFHLFTSRYTSIILNV